jgi:c-di-GMP-binding flagellar brake protein YcgR
MGPTGPRSKGERRAFRVSVVPRDPVRWAVTIDEAKVNPVVDELSIGGARLMSVKYFDLFYEGQILGPGTLPLDGIGTLSVSGVVKWKNFPQIGIEFVDMTENESEKLFRYLFKISRLAIRYERAKKLNPPRQAKTRPDESPNKAPVG